MLKAILFLVLLFQGQSPSILGPKTGDTLRGQVEVTGVLDVPGFSSAELAFTYDASNSAASWFTIQTFPQPKTDLVLAIWDTTSITDGDYALRLRVFFEDGAVQDVVITGLKVRNDAPEPALEVTQENVSPQIPATVAIPTLIPATPTYVVVQPTPAAANPASLEVSTVYAMLARGALTVIILFALIALLLRIRKNS